MSRQIFPASLIRSTTQCDCTQHSVISVRNNLKINTPGKGSKQQPEALAQQGRTPNTGNNLILVSGTGTGTGTGKTHLAIAPGVVVIHQRKRFYNAVDRAN